MSIIKKLTALFHTHSFPDNIIYLYWEGGGGESRCWEFTYRMCPHCDQPVMYSRMGNVTANALARQGFIVQEVPHPDNEANPHYEKWQKLKAGKEK